MLEFGPLNRPKGDMQSCHSKLESTSMAELSATNKVSVPLKSRSQTTTRSLSAVVRRKTPSSFDNPPSQLDMAELSEAVDAENAMVDKAPREGEGKRNKPKSRKAERALHGGGRTSPNQKFLIKVPNVQPQPATDVPPEPGQRHVSVQQGAGDDIVASQSLTEKTLKIITEKVRIMNKKYVSCKQYKFA